MGWGVENVRIKNETLVLTTKNNVCVERTLCGVFFHRWFVEVMVVVVLRLTVRHVRYTICTVLGARDSHSCREVSRSVGRT